MADTKNAPATEATEGKRKRKGPTGPRQEKPVFAVVSYTDESGNKIKLNKNGLSIRFTKDAFELVRIMENGDGTEVVKEVERAKDRANPTVEANAAQGEQAQA